MPDEKEVLDPAAQSENLAPTPASAAVPEEDDEPKKKKGVEEEHKCPECPPCKPGAPAWMATFADMATLLMAFFVLILSFAEMNVPKFKQISGSMKNSFGVQRLIPVVEAPKAQSLIAREFSPSVAEPTPLNTVRQQTTDDRQENVLLKTDVAPEAMQALQAMKQALAAEISRGEAQVKFDKGKVVVEMTATPSGGGAGPSGQQQGGASSSGSSQGGSASAGSSQGGSASAGASQGGAASAGASQGGAAAKGERQSGVVTQGEIEFYAKVADVQSQVQAAVEVRDLRGAAGDQSGTGRTKGGGNIDAELARVRQDLSKEIQSGKVEVERDGAKIIIRLSEQGSFQSGRADLQPGFMTTLNQVGQTVSSSRGRVFIEGHTDNVPVMFNERFRSNWDLSGARAGAVADFLSASAGITPSRLSVAGYADTRPIDSNANANGRSRNRRIEVIIDGASN